MLCISVLQGYSLDMLNVMKTMESKLFSQGLLSTELNRRITSCPSRLRVVSCSNTSELSTIMESLKEITVENCVGILLCVCFNIQEDRKIMGLLYNRLYELTKQSQVSVIYNYVQLDDVPPPKYLKNPTANLLWCQEKNSLTIHRTSSKN